jgi:hypothetical protein
MRLQAKPLVTIGIGAVLFFAIAPLCQAAIDSFLDGQLKVLDSKIASWDHSATVVGTLVFLAVMVGIIVAAMQAASKWWWMKVVIAVLSIIGAGLGAYSHQFFPADDRAYHKAARQAGGLVMSFRLQLERLRRMDDKTRDSLYDSFKDLLVQVGQIEEGIADAAVSSPKVTTISLISSAYAQTEPVKGTPEWVTNPPNDEKNFYFAGSASAKSFDQAKQDAIANAQAAASASFRKEATNSVELKDKPALVDQLVHAIVAGGEITRTLVLPSATGDEFTGYALMRISKAPARFAAESIFVRKSEAYDKLFLNHVQPKEER